MDDAAGRVQPGAGVPADARSRDAGPRLQRVHAPARSPLPGAQALDPAALVRPGRASPAHRTPHRDGPGVRRLGRRRPRLGAAGARPVLDGLLPLAPGGAGARTSGGTALDEANARIMDAVNRTGEVFLSHTRLDDRFTIRLSVGNLRTEPRHVARAWELLRRETRARGERRGGLDSLRSPAGSARRAPEAPAMAVDVTNDSQDVHRRRSPSPSTSGRWIEVRSPATRRARRARAGRHRGGRRPRRRRRPGRLQGRPLAPDGDARARRDHEPARRPARPRRRRARRASRRSRPGTSYKLRRDSDFAFASDNLRFFATQIRNLEGKAAYEYTRQPHELRPPRADRRRRPGQPVELPDVDGDLEDRAGAGGRQLDRPQARQRDAADDDPPGRAGRWRPASRPASSTWSPGRGDVVGAALAGAHGRRPHLAHRRHGDRQARSRRSPSAQPQAGPPGARRQGAVHRLRGRRHRGRGARRDRRGAHQRRPGLHGGDPRLRPSQRRTTRSWRARPSCSTASASATRSTRRRTCGTLISETQVARVGRVRASARSPPARASSPAAYRPEVAGPPGRRVLPPDGHRRLRPGQRDRPARGLRAGPGGPAVRHRRGGAREGQRHAATASRLASGRATSARRDGAARTLNFGHVQVNDHLMVTSRDAARRLQAVRLRARTCRRTRSRSTRRSST